MNIIKDESKLKNFGLKPSKFDSRDYQYSAVCNKENVSLPSMFQLVCSPIRNQGLLGSCVGHGATAIMECDSMTNGDNNILSPLDLYSECKAIDGISSEGTTLRDALSVLKNRGVCTERIYPYLDNNDVKNNVFPSKVTSVIEDANKRKIESYSALHSIDEVKKAIYNENGVLLGMCVTDSYYCTQDGTIGRPTGYIYGNHCVACVGWDDEKEVTYDYNKAFKFGDETVNTETYKGCFIIKNSWGEEWGDKGYGYVPYDVFDLGSSIPFGVNLVFEAWTTSHIKGTNYNPNYHIDNQKKIIELQIGNKIAKINGKNIELDTTPVTKNERVLVPVRFVAETFGAAVEWEQEKQIVKIIL